MQHIIFVQMCVALHLYTMTRKVFSYRPYYILLTFEAIFICQKYHHHVINRIIRWTLCHKCRNQRAYVCHKKKKVLTHHLLSIIEYPYFSPLWVKIDQLKQLKGYTMVVQYISCGPRQANLCLRAFRHEKF